MWLHHEWPKCPHATHFLKALDVSYNDFRSFFQYFNVENLTYFHSLDHRALYYTMIQNRESVELGEKIKMIIWTKTLTNIVGDILGFQEMYGIRPFGTFMTSQCIREDDPFLPSRKNVKFTEHFIKSTNFTSMPTERFSE